MKKSVEVPTKSVQEKRLRKPSFPNVEREKSTPFRKQDTPMNNSFRATRPNAHDPVDDELPIPNLPDRQAGRYPPSEEPW